MSLKALVNKKMYLSLLGHHKLKLTLGRIQDLVRGGSDKRPPTLSKCYCNLTSPFFRRKSMVKILFPFHFRGFVRTTPGSAPASPRYNPAQLPIKKPTQTL